MDINYDSESNLKGRGREDTGTRDFKLNQRMYETSQHSNTNENIDRMLLDRDNMFSQDSRFNTQPKRNYVKKQKMGEITGEEFESQKMDQGMPLRSQYNSKKNDVDLEKAYNKYLDFNIFDDEQPESNLEVSYFDPNGGSVFSFSDIGKTNLPKKSEPIFLISNCVTDYSFFIYENLRNLMQDNSLIVSHSIVDILCSLYISGKANTESEIKNYLTLLDKDSVYSGCLELKKYITKSQCYDFKNILLINKKIPVNSDFIDYISPLTTCFTINTTDPVREANKLNTYLNSQYNNIFGQIFRPDHMNNLDITCLTVGLLRTVWKTPFDKIIKAKFIGKDISVKDMVYCSGKTHNYFEDDDFQVLEMKLYDDVLSMGFILPKKLSHKLPQINLKDFEVYIEHMKPSVLDEIVIPIFKTQCKLRVSNILKKTGLSGIFNKADFTELLGNQTKITDFVQNITLIFDDKYIPKTEKPSYKNHGIMSNRKFIANRPFIYYFRLLSTKTIILIGQYYK
jgi:serine protease inhibitor